MSALDLTWYNLKKSWYDSEDFRGDQEDEEAHNQREAEDLDSFHAKGDDYHTFREDGDPHDEDVDSDFSSGENRPGKTSEYQRGWIAGARHQQAMMSGEEPHPETHRTITGKHTKTRWEEHKAKSPNLEGVEGHTPGESLFG